VLVYQYCAGHHDALKPLQLGAVENEIEAGTPRGSKDALRDFGPVLYGRDDTDGIPARLSPPLRRCEHYAAEEELAWDISGFIGSAQLCDRSRLGRELAGASSFDV
jgi:hypothetical protein